MGGKTALALLAILGALTALLPRLGGGMPSTGQVLGVAGPLAGARVRFKGTAVSTLSDAAGRFTLPGPGEHRRITAWKEGHFIGGSPPHGAGAVRLRRLPARDHEGYVWVDPDPQPGAPGHCGNCHAPVWREWAASGHARSATGRHFRNLYDGSTWQGGKAGWSLLDEHPDGAGVCASCHAPTVRDDDPALFDLRRVRGVAARGVHCDYCHKVADLAEGTIGLTHGRFLHRLLRPAEGQLNFGPLDDVDRGEETFAPLYRESRYCAACHEGVVFGVRVYSTYSEWLDSPARRAGHHCQHCHMKPTGQLTNFAPGRGGIERDPSTLGNHAFWDRSQEEMLRRCLELDVSWQVEGGGVRVTVKLTARNVGHAVPTGFIDRHVLLVVEGQDKHGRPVKPRAGPTLPAAAGSTLVGQAGRLYARLARDGTGRAPVPFWGDVARVEDTRLWPDKPDGSTFTFSGQLACLRVRILHRRFWAEQQVVKGWPDSDLVILDRLFHLAGAFRAREQQIRKGNM